jgi:hypothetical protein
MKIKNSQGAGRVLAKMLFLGAELVGNWYQHMMARILVSR